MKGSNDMETKETKKTKILVDISTFFTLHANNDLYREGKVDHSYKGYLCIDEKATNTVWNFIHRYRNQIDEVVFLYCSERLNAYCTDDDNYRGLVIRNEEEMLKRLTGIFGNITGVKLSVTNAYVKHPFKRYDFILTTDDKSSNIIERTNFTKHLDKVLCVDHYNGLAIRKFILLLDEYGKKLLEVANDER